MIIIIQTDEATITYDNHSPMADKNMIAYGEVTKGMCVDGEISKTKAKEIIMEYVTEFLKWISLKGITGL